MLNDQDLPDDEEFDDEVAQLNLLDQLNNLNIHDNAHDDDHNPATGLGKEGARFVEASRRLLNPNNAIFAKDRPSSKVGVFLPPFHNISS